jgi:hypothetical protein
MKSFSVISIHGILFSITDTLAGLKWKTTRTINDGNISKMIPQAIAEMEMSWERIFELKFPQADPAWLGGQRAERIQATFEELHIEMVRQTTFFRARPPKRF